MLSKGKGIVFPKTKTTVEGKSSKLMQVFNTGKEQHLHSISQSADNENFLAADDYSIHLYNLHKPLDAIFNMVDYERSKDKSQNELITSARFD